MPQQTPSNATVGFVLITNLTLWKHSEWSLISMPNMSYCRYENTVNDMWDCLEHMYDSQEDMSEYEKDAYVRFLNMIVNHAPECESILESME